MNCFQNVKYGVSCREAAERYGVEVNRCGMALCPFHNDRHPSLYAADDHYYCFACGEHGDVIDFAAKLFGLPLYAGGAASGSRLSPHTGQAAQRSGAPRKACPNRSTAAQRKRAAVLFCSVRLRPRPAGAGRYSCAPQSPAGSAG